MSDECVVGVDTEPSQSSENETIISGYRVRPNLRIGVNNSYAQHSSSTPVRGDGARLVRFGSNVSSIHGTALSPVQEREVPSQDILENSVFEERISRKPRKKINRGKNWNYFKPIKQNSIYSIILMGPEDAVMRVYDFLGLFENSKSKALYALLQFVIDVSGFQNFEIPKNLNMELKENYSDVLSLMQDNPPEYQLKSGLYLLKITSEQALISLEAIFKFISRLVKEFHETSIMYKYSIMNHLTHLLLSFTVSKNRALRHTGVVLVAKILTVLYEIQEKVRIEINKSARRVSHNDKYQDLMEKQNILNTVILTYQTAIENNCGLMDPKLSDMKITIVKEMWLWFKINHKLLSPEKSKYFKRLMNFVRSKPEDLRMAALTVCHDLVKTDDYGEDLTPLINKFTQVVGGRVKDIASDVQILTVKIFTSMLYTYIVYVPRDTRSLIMLLVYNKNCTLAVAAGEFLTKAIRCGPNINLSESVVIERLLIFHKQCDKDYLIPVLVESLLPSFPELKNWKCLIELLLKDDIMDRLDEINLIEILSQAMQQVIVGHCTKYIRANAVCVIPEKKNNRIIMDHLLPNVLPLLRKFQDQVKSILHILEILLVIDYRDAYLSQFRQVMFEILHEFKAIFRNINNQDLLNSISKLYGLVSDDLSAFGEPFIKFVTIVKESTIQELKNLIESNRDRTLSTEDNLKIELCYLKLSCLFIHHDLSPYLNSNVLLNDVLPASKSFGVKTTKYGISCCFSYITWMLNIFIDILNEANFEEELVGPVELKSMTDNYVKACFQFIKETNHILIRTEAFNNIHKIYIRFHKELQPLIKIDKNLKKCLPVPFTSTETNDFMICAQIILFEDNDDDTYLARRQTLNWVLSMFSLKVMNLPELVKIYKYYHSHFACYGDLLDVYLQDLRNISSVAVSAFVMKNVLYCYLNNILNLRAEQLEVADIELKKLTKQFQVFMSKHPEELKLSLKFGFQYAIAAENRLKILSYVKYFVNSLPLQEKKEIFELVEEKVPNEFRNHVLILEFISYFKTKQSLNVNASASNAETESEEEADTTTIENFTSDEQTVPDRTDENIIEEYASD